MATVHAPASELVDTDFFESLQQHWLDARRQAEALVVGIHKSRSHGASTRYAEHRAYQPGDDLRKLDWRAYARTDRDMVRHFEHESQLRAHLLMDCSGSMDFGDGSEHKAHFAASLLATFAYALIQRGDAVGCSLFSRSISDGLPARAQPSQLKAILGLLAQGREASGETQLAPTLSTLLARLPRRSLVIVASDLLDFSAGALDGLHQLHGRGSDIIVLQVVSRDELSLAGHQPAEFEGLENESSVRADPERMRSAYHGALERFLGDCAAACRRAGALYQLCPTDVPPAHSLASVLHQHAHRRTR